MFGHGSVIYEEEAIPRTVEVQSVEHVEAAFDEKVLGSVGGGVGSIFEDGKDTSHQFAVATPTAA
jgi:hypothetical protein